MRNKTVFFLSLASFLGLLGAIFASTLFFPGLRTSVINTFPMPECDVLLHPCTSRLTTGETVTLSLSATILPTMIPLTVEVKTEHLEPISVIVDFSGVNMFMGENQPMLSRKETQIFTGKTILPICSKSNMPWEATVYIDTEKGRLAAPFRFSVIKPASRLSS